MSAYAPDSATLVVGNGLERVDVLDVNASFFPMLGVRPPELGGGRLRSERAQVEINAVSRRRKPHIRR